ncbi:unnamed protein product [Paramecium primaurelia]|uniref:Transmembrane protein n=1 Tax=Paramecium primaurelia TaxID=5886 RepID=A0A8S1N4Q7_PARPR|nr:unnamed protein product [Paramecium primaurelia]
MYIYTSYEKNQPNQPLHYIDDSLEQNQTQYTQQFEVESIENDQKLNDSLKRADYISSVYAALVIENFIIPAVILLGLFSELQFWLITKTPNIKDFCYCETKKALECEKGCLVSQIDSYDIKPTYLFYCFFIIGVILQIWLNLGITYIRKQFWVSQLVLLIVIFSCYALTISTICILIAYNFGIGLILVGWVNAFVIIFCFAFYSMKTKSEINYGIGATFILSPTLLFLITYIKMSPNYAIYFCLNSIILITFGFFLIWESKKILSQQKIIRLSIIEILIGSELLIACINQVIFRAIEFCKNSKKTK